MSACRVPFHRVFVIFKTNFYFTMRIRKCGDHTASSHCTQYVKLQIQVYISFYLVYFDGYIALANRVSEVFVGVLSITCTFILIIGKHPPTNARLFI